MDIKGAGLRVNKATEELRRLTRITIESSSFKEKLIGLAEAINRAGLQLSPTIGPNSVVMISTLGEKRKLLEDIYLVGRGETELNPPLIKKSKTEIVKETRRKFIESKMGRRHNANKT